MKFNKIPQATFEDMILNAGMLLRNFNPSNPAAPADADIICATTGGVNPTCVPEFDDFFADVDNAPNNTKEGKQLTGWTCGLATTCLGISPAQIKLALGAADISGNAVVPRRNLKLTDFEDHLWWVGDKAGGGWAAICLLNALSTGGFSLQTTKNGKGQIALSLTGHVSITDQDVVPMEFYSADSEDESVEYVFTAVRPSGNENPAEEGWYILSGDIYRLTNDTAVDENKTYYERTEAGE